MPTRRRYDETTFRQVLEDPAVTTIAEICRRLGIVPCGGNYESIRRYADQLGLGDRVSTRTPRYASSRRTPWREEPEEFRRICGSARSIAAILSAFGVTSRSAWTYETVRRDARALGIDLAALPGQAWARGRPRLDQRRPIEELGRGTSLAALKLRLLESGRLPHRCQGCSLSEWLDGPIPLEFDHIDGDRRNNDPTNLRLLCPNCHALTPTYRGRNIGRYD
ncbi:MAG: HNH endonuclease [Nitriliruptoraceae bacterium]|nr:HNH endonuclease [Nitriliruptoraceae bacterium]